MEEEFAKLQSHLNELLKEDDLNVANVVEFTLRLMMFAESFDKLTGPDKKNLILNVLTQYVQENVGDAKVLVMELINFTIPPLIDTMIALDRGDLKIHLRKFCDKVKSGCGVRCCKKK